MSDETTKVDDTKPKDTLGNEAEASIEAAATAEEAAVTTVAPAAAEPAAAEESATPVVSEPEGPIEPDAPRDLTPVFTLDPDAAVLIKSLAVMLGLFLVLFSVTAIVWRVANTAAIPTTALKGHLAQGEKVFREVGCWQCHHPTLKGQRWGGGFGVQRPDTWWVAYLSKPRVVHRRATKQSVYRLLNRADSGRYSLHTDGQALVAYVRYLREMGLGGASTPRFPRKVSPGALRATAYFANVTGVRGEHSGQVAVPQRPAEGKALYRRYCQNCHGSAGRGDGPLASLLPQEPQDLARIDVYKCRTSKVALPHDIARTIRKGTGGCGVIPLGQVLTQPQLANLVETARRIALMQGGRTSTKLTWPRRRLPTRGDTMSRAFQKWLDAWWKRNYKDWRKRFYPYDRSKPKYRAAQNWRTWIEWQSFHRWVRRHPNSLKASRADWVLALQKQGVFPNLARPWRQAKHKLSFLGFAKAQLRKDLRKELGKEYDTVDASSIRMMKKAVAKAKPKDRKKLEKALRRKLKTSGEQDRLSRIKRLSWYQLWKRGKYAFTYFYRGDWVDRRVKSRWRDYLRRKGFSSYEGWREREEKSQFRRWRDEQQKLLYMAWRGQTAFRDLGCQKCHGSRQPTMPIPAHKRVHLPKLNYKMVNVAHGKAKAKAKAKSKKAKGKKKLAKKATKKSVKKVVKKPALPYLDLARAGLKCGTGHNELFRTVVVGMGTKMPGLKQHQLRKYLGVNHLSSLRGRSGAFAPAASRSIWEVVAYVQFLTKELPILQAIPRQK